MLLLAREIERFQKSGLTALVVAALIAGLFIFKWIDFIKIIWPAYMNLHYDYHIPSIIHSGLFTVFQSAIILVLGSILCFFFYWGRFPYIEKFRAKGSSDEKWPWDSMSKTEWRKLLRRSILLNLINLGVCTNLISVSLYFLGFEDPHPTDIDKMPTVPVFIA